VNVFPEDKRYRVRLVDGVRPGNVVGNRNWPGDCNGERHPNLDRDLDVYRDRNVLDDLNGNRSRDGHGVGPVDVDRVGLVHRDIVGHLHLEGDFSFDGDGERSGHRNCDVTLDGDPVDVSLGRG